MKKEARDMDELTDPGERHEPLEKKWRKEVRELEAAGWEKLERLEKIVWRRPESGYLYPQDVAIRLVREARHIRETRGGGGFT